MTNILLIEDTEILRMCTARILQKEQFAVTTAEDGQEGVAIALKTTPDLILCDVRMPRMDGYQVLEQLKQNPETRAIPFIFLSAKDARQDVRRGMYLGADDYLTKPFSRSELLEAIQSQLKKRAAIQSHYKDYLIRLEDASALKQQQDGVTGLNNIYYLQNQFNFFVNRFDNQQIRNPRHSFHLPFCLIQLERNQTAKQILSFEQYNQLLSNVAERIQTILGKSGELALINDNEFGLLYDPIEQQQHASYFAEEISTSFAEPYIIGTQEVFLDARLSISFYPRSGHGLDELIQAARSTLNNTAKFNTQKYFFAEGENHSNSQKQAFIETELHYALARNELEVFYQPQIDLDTGKVSGFEALLRWTHPELGTISPVDFIPIAEETGLIQSIGYWSLRTATSEVRHWQRKYKAELRLAINLSGYQLNHKYICQDILKILAEEDFDPEYLDIEITESILIEDFQEISERLKQLQRVGVRIAIDDFGTGYSSFNYTRLFSWDILKIDRCFVNNLHKSKVNAAITKGLIEMSHALGFLVIAEGVENSSELAVLNDYGCDIVQGYFLGRPVSAKVLEKNIFQSFDTVSY
ncbi:response regulator receiver modulated diguanylate cyclase/phosphodiesterase [[Leptolyngbya] sp. PCC 7376]|uniref:two-component system response regulator n=1 Tax=[Leptolyngbya] sp. PCC 7376 TaxID=111781 RepID=UPI00029F32B8|nr:EAL domain-containing protein [[Leptolyngbya] sp. PCC 7376]AFY39189.1 response regulator receiver modulated diguanylate cyclase/phosphodiesterase [[Leptolyngbya] sp. PCC 7376]